MECFRWYGSYGIRYHQISGTTSIEFNGRIIKSFVGCGEMAGDEKAVDWIDHEMRFED